MLIGCLNLYALGQPQANRFPHLRARTGGLTYGNPYHESMDIRRHGPEGVNRGDPIDAALFADIPQDRGIRVPGDMPVRHRFYGHGSGDRIKGAERQQVLRDVLHVSQNEWPTLTGYREHGEVFCDVHRILAREVKPAVNLS